MNLRRLPLFLIPTALTLAAPAWGEARQPAPKAAQARPLNLSLPREALTAPTPDEADAAMQRNLRAAEPPGAMPPAPLRYGAGYEQRQQSLHGAAPGSSPGNGAAAGGAGRRGR